MFDTECTAGNNLFQAPPFANNLDITAEYQKSVGQDKKVIIVLDDDPTGIQTVHDVSVYMQWTRDIVRTAFSTERLFFIQTNSRAFSPGEAQAINAEIMVNLIDAAQGTGLDFAVISRSDSTLRGYYPLETAVLRDVYERKTGKQIHGEILIPFFSEAGRVTCRDIHYVREGKRFIPAGETEFAKDSIFGFHSSDLKYYIEEKTQGAFSHEQVISIDLESIRSGNLQAITQKLRAARDFAKIIVNALCYDDLRMFIIALKTAEAAGKRFLFRTAASFVKAYGNIEDKALLTKHDFEQLAAGEQRPVLTIVGSYVRKTTAQLAQLLHCEGIFPIEINVNELLQSPQNKEKTIHDIVCSIEQQMKAGKNPVVYTSRGLVTHADDNKEANLRIFKEVSAALSQIVRSLSVRPGCIIAKGGITSHDIAVSGLGIKKGRVLGQVLPSIPVLAAGQESKWPQMAYVIFPGNVGDETALAQVYNIIK
ncbi:MAG: hydroxyacid dehydrogenase [Sporomusa sp.]|nr:hydroxyacid dehydrogenase [Sporomusa sp.]